MQCLCYKVTLVSPQWIWHMLDSASQIIVWCTLRYTPRLFEFNVFEVISKYHHQYSPYIIKFTVVVTRTWVQNVNLVTYSKIMLYCTALDTYLFHLLCFMIWYHILVYHSQCSSANRSGDKRLGSHFPRQFCGDISEPKLLCKFNKNEIQWSIHDKYYKIYCI